MFSALTDSAHSCDIKELWALIGKLQLARGDWTEALRAYVMGECHTNYVEVLKAVKDVKDFGKIRNFFLVFSFLSRSFIVIQFGLDKWEDFAAYLQMVHSFVPDPAIHAALAVCLVKANKIEDLEKLRTCLLVRPSITNLLIS